MVLKTKIQCIRRKSSQQWYVNFPAQVAEIMDFQAGEQLEWQLVDRTQLVLNRTDPPPVPEIKKKQKLE